ncbi:hypothetical protein [Microcoleus sp. F4-D5]|uniref:hypothetical protein n=1 Tax=Microcoleus sp. F4-D5 TaxID=2818760 RepID=UPI002FD2290E
MPLVTCQNLLSMQQKNVTPAHQNHPVVENFSLQSQSSALEPCSQWVQRLIRRAPIRQKIGLGYAVALGIAVLGAIAGQLVGDFYTKQASQRLNIE